MRRRDSEAARWPAYYSCSAARLCVPMGRSRVRRHPGMSPLERASARGTNRGTALRALCSDPGWPGNPCQHRRIRRSSRADRRRNSRTNLPPRRRGHVCTKGTPFLVPHQSPQARLFVLPLIGRILHVQSLTNAGVLVTGAGRGIGKRLALGFAAAGAKVGLLARSKAELDLAHLEIEHAGGNALRIRTDVTDFEQLNAAVDRMRRDYGGVHVLICAAAIQGPIGSFLDQSPKAWADTIHINLLGVMNACKAVLPHMIQRRSGKIIVLTGPGATGPRPNFSALAASKAAVVRLV